MGKSARPAYTEKVRQNMALEIWRIGFISVEYSRAPVSVIHTPYRRRMYLHLPVHAVEKQMLLPVLIFVMLELAVVEEARDNSSHRRHHPILSP